MKSVRHALFAGYVLLCALALIWPGYAWFGARIEPRVLGVPFSLAWVVGWVLLSFVVMSVYHATGSTTARAGGES